VQTLRNMLELVRARLTGLPASAKLLAGSLVVILALGLFLVAQWSAKTSSVPFAVNATAFEEARKYLATRNVAFEEKNGQILVPAESHAELIAGFAETGAGAEVDWGKLMPSDPFATEGERKTRHLLALQTVLAHTISGFRNVKAATVLISPKPTTALGSSRNTQTASVHVTMRSGALTQDQVDAIAAMVSGTQAGMKPDGVSITDGAQAYRTAASRTGSSGENLEQSLKIADTVQSRILNLLSSIDGVRVSVNPQVVTTARTIRKSDYRDPITAPLQESNTTSSTKGASSGREPGVVPNTGLSIGGTQGGGSQSEIEKTDSHYVAKVPTTELTEIDPTGYATKIDVGIAVPWSYFVQVCKMQGASGGAAADAAKEPSKADVEKVRDEELPRIKKLVEPLVATDAVECAKKGTVEVSWFYDFSDRAPATSMAAGLGEIVLGGGSGGTGGGGLIKPITLGVLAIASLFFMFNIAKKASVRENLPTAEELAGVPPKLESDDAEIVGEADEATPALEGMELDDDSLRRAQMLEQLNELADRDPVEIAGILRRWMRTTA